MWYFIDMFQVKRVNRTFQISHCLDFDVKGIKDLILNLLELRFLQTLQPSLEQIAPEVAPHHGENFIWSFGGRIGLRY